MFFRGTGELSNNSIKNLLHELKKKKKVLPKKSGKDPDYKNSGFWFCFVCCRSLLMGDNIKQQGIAMRKMKAKSAMTTN